MKYSWANFYRFWKFFCIIFFFRRISGQMRRCAKRRNRRNRMTNWRPFAVLQKSYDLSDHTFFDFPPKNKNIRAKQSQILVSYCSTDTFVQTKEIIITSSLVLHFAATFGYQTRWQFCPRRHEKCWKFCHKSDQNIISNSTQHRRRIPNSIFHSKK